MQYKSNIIPELQIRTGSREELDLESICIFMALGYFLGDRTFYKGLKQHLPASMTETDEQGNVRSSTPYFKWHYSPRDISFDQAVEEFTHIFEGIIAEKGDQGYTIPISGGLDSRTLLAACQTLGKSYKGYSYAFDGGHDETVYGKKMSELLGFDFDTYKVKKGQLWTYVDRLAVRNECYSEFTHARQYAFHDTLSSKGGTFLLGHGGDLYFDDMGVPSNLNDDEILKVLWSRIVKKSGLELAVSMWKHWGMQGDFKQFLENELKKCLQGIDIPDANAKLRAFKSLYYVPRWTCVNLQIFQDFGPVVIPYFDDRICQFICTVPEHLLKGRKIQIEYLKRRQPGLARIPWQSHYPFNLYNYQLDRVPFNLPYRIVKKISRMLKGENPVTRNWELQFKGEKNEQNLTQALTGDKRFLEFIPEQMVRYHLDSFLNKDSLAFYPSVTMLLTLSKFIGLMHER